MRKRLPEAIKSPSASSNSIARPARFLMFKQRGEIDHFITVADRLGRYNHFEVRFFSTGHDGLFDIQQVHDLAQVASVVQRVIGRNRRRGAVENQQALSIQDRGVGLAIPVEIADIDIQRRLDIRGDHQAFAEPGKSALLVGKAEVHNGFERFR